MAWIHYQPLPAGINWRMKGTEWEYTDSKTLLPLTPVTFETAKSSFASKLQNDVYDFFSEITPIKVILM